MRHASAGGNRLVRIAAATMLALGLPLLLANSYVWPLDAVVDGDLGGDHSIFIWNAQHMTESMLAGRNPFRADDIYYPVGANLGRHTYCFGFVPVGLAARTLTGHARTYPLAAYRASIWICFAGGFALGYGALRCVGIRPLASLWGACAYVFSAFFLCHTPHLNVVGGALVVPGLSLAAFCLWNAPSWRSAAALGAALGVSVYFSELSVHAALALGLACALVGILPSTRGELKQRLRLVGGRGLLAAALAGGLIAAPLLLSWTRDSGKAPRPEASYLWSADLLGFTFPNGSFQPAYAWLSAPRARRQGTGIDGREVFLGFPLLLLLLVSLFQRRSAWWWIGVGLGSLLLVLSLGPEVHVGGPGVGVPAPYLWLMRVPPFNMARTPVRLIGVALWPLMCVASHALSRLSTALETRVGRRAAVGLGAVLLTWSAAEGYRPGPAVVAFMPPRELDALEAGPVLNLPISFMDGRAMFLQVFHKRPMLTGFVARRSPAQVEQTRRLDALAEQGPEAFAAELVRRGVRNVIAGPRTREEWIAGLRGAGLTVVDLRRLE